MTDNGSLVINSLSLSHSHMRSGVAASFVLFYVSFPSVVSSTVMLHRVINIRFLFFTCLSLFPGRFPSSRSPRPRVTWLAASAVCSTPAHVRRCCIAAVDWAQRPPASCCPAATCVSTRSWARAVRCVWPRCAPSDADTRILVPTPSLLVFSLKRFHLCTDSSTLGNSSRSRVFSLSPFPSFRLPFRNG